MIKGLIKKININISNERLMSKLFTILKEFKCSLFISKINAITDKMESYSNGSITECERNYDIFMEGYSNGSMTGKKLNGHVKDELEGIFIRPVQEMCYYDWNSAKTFNNMMIKIINNQNTDEITEESLSRFIKKYFQAEFIKNIAEFIKNIAEFIKNIHQKALDKKRERLHKVF